MRLHHIAWIVCLLALCVFVSLKITSGPLETTPSTVAGVKLGGPFSLTDQNGKTTTDKSWPGKYLLVYFGFTHCPDICPLGLSRMTDALKKVPSKTRDAVQPVFITLDPARDTVKAMKEYVVLFDKNLVGLTGPQKDIDHIAGLYRVYAQKDGTGDDYMINHSGYTYLMNPQGELAAVFPHETTADELAEQLKKNVISESSAIPARANEQ